MGERNILARSKENIPLCSCSMLHDWVANCLPPSCCWAFCISEHFFKRAKTVNWAQHHRVVTFKCPMQIVCSNRWAGSCRTWFFRTFLHVERKFFFPNVTTCLLRGGCLCFLCITVGSLPYNIECLEVTVVVTQC